MYLILLCEICKNMRCFLEKFTQLARILHDRRSRRSWQISSLPTNQANLESTASAKEYSLAMSFLFAPSPLFYWRIEKDLWAVYRQRNRGFTITYCARWTTHSPLYILFILPSSPPSTFPPSLVSYFSIKFETTVLAAIRIYSLWPWKYAAVHNSEAITT